MSTGSINVVLNVDSTGFTSGLTTAQTGLKNLNLSINNSVKNASAGSSAFSALGVSMHGIIIKAALAGDALRNINAVTTGFMYAIAKSNGELERMQTLMTGMSKATTAAGKAVDGLKDMSYVMELAKNSPVALSGLTDAFVKLKTTGIDPTKGALQTLVDANAHFGGTEDSLKRASVAISQMSSKGKVSMEELRQQLAEAIPNASQLMARGMGMSMEELIKAVSKGSVNSKEAISVMLHEMQIEFAGSAKEMMNTWVGLTSQLGTQWLLFQKEIGDASFFDEAKNALRDLVGLLKTEDMAAFAASFGHTLAEATQGFISMTKYVLENREEVKKWAIIAGEAVVVMMSWNKIVAITTSLMAFGGALKTTVTALSYIVASMITTGEVAAGFGLILETLGLALTGPVGIAAALVGCGLAWFNWGSSATNALADVDQAIKDGVKVSKEGMAAIEESIAKGIAAKAKQQAIGEHTTSGNFIGFFSNPAQLNEDIAEAEKSKSKLIAINNNHIKAVSKASIEAQNKAFEAESTASAERRRTSSINDYNSLTDKNAPEKIDKTEYKRRKDARDGSQYTDEIDGINKVTDGLVKEARARNLDTTALIANGAERVKDVKLKQIEMLGNDGNFLSADTKKTDAATKKAATELERQANVYDNLVARLDKAKATLSQPYDGLGTKASEIGPEETKIQSLIDSGHKYKANIIEIAHALDMVNVAQSRQTKALDALNGQLRNASKNEAKSIVDLNHSMDVLSNGGYETMSKQTLRLNEQMAITEEAIDRVSEGIDKESGSYKKLVADIRAKTKAYVDDQNSVQNNNRNGQGLIAASHTEADLLPTFQSRADAKYAIQIKAYRAENGLADQSMEHIKATNAGMYAELKAMGDQYARDTELPIQTMGRQWEDVNRNMQVASASWMDGFSLALTDMVMTGKSDFAGLAKAIMADIAKMIIQMLLFKAIKMAAGAAGFAFEAGGVMTPDGPASLPSPMSATPSTGVSWSFDPKLHANGGVFGKNGSMPLNAYSTGGIANSPQVAIFGEGRQNEAYVPLPDGKSIPVTMQGANGSNISISINVDNKGNSTDKKDSNKNQDSSEMWNKMAGSIKNIVITTLTEQRRPGGQLWSN